MQVGAAGRRRGAQDFDRLIQLQSVADVEPDAVTALDDGLGLLVEAVDLELRIRLQLRRDPVDR